MFRLGALAGALLIASTTLAALATRLYVHAETPVDGQLQSPGLDSALRNANPFAFHIGADTGRWRSLALQDPNAHRLCQMPVAVPDTSRIESMPTADLGSTRAVPMPGIRASCYNPLFQR
jgi:hypothetical protein